MILTFGTARKAKELGFTTAEGTDCAYGSDWDFKRDIDKRKWNILTHVAGIPVDNIEAATQSELQKWLRETHSIYIDSKTYIYETYVEYEMLVRKDSKTYDMGVSQSYETILEIALQQALELVN